MTLLHLETMSLITTASECLQRHFWVIFREKVGEKLPQSVENGGVGTVVHQVASESGVNGTNEMFGLDGTENRFKRAVFQIRQQIFRIVVLLPVGFHLQFSSQIGFV